MKLSNKLKNISLKDIKPFKNNPKKHSDDQINKIKKSIENNEYIQPICIDKNNIIVIGHGRYYAMQLINPDMEIEVIDLSDKTEKEIQKLRIVDNTLNESEWDYNKLESELKDIYSDIEKDIDLINEELNIEKDYINDIILKDKYADKEDQEDEIPEIKKSIIKLGDLIELGKHRLLCGDSTKKEDVDKLMNGEKADIIFTDPPYGIDVVGKSPRLQENKKLGSIGGDGIAKVWLYKKVLNDGDVNTGKAAIRIFKGTNMIIWGGNYFTDILKPSRGWIVWDKKNGATTFADCELAYTTFDKSIRKYDYLWSGMMRKGSHHIEGKYRYHPTQKPVGLLIKIIEEWFDNKCIVTVDLFLGSGSTLIACEKTGRICYGMELDEYYCNVIIERYCKYTDNYNIKINGKEINWKNLKK